MWKARKPSDTSAMRRARVRDRRRLFFELCRDSRLQEPQRGCRIVGELKKRKILSRDHAVPHKGLEINDLVPVTRSVQHNRNVTLDLSRLHQRQDLHQFVERAESTRKHNKPAGEICKPELAHEEVMELERELARDVGVWPLLVRQSDVEPDGLAAGLRSATVGGLHDAAAAAGANDVPVSVRRETLRPDRDQARELARRVVVIAQWSVRDQPCGAEKYDRVANTFAVKSVHRLEVFGKDAQRTCIVTVEELLVLVGEPAARRIDPTHGFAPMAAKSINPRETSVRSSCTRTRSPTSRPSDPRTTLPSATGPEMRTHVPLSDAPVTMPSNCVPIRDARSSAATDFPTCRSTFAALSS